MQDRNGHIGLIPAQKQIPPDEWRNKMLNKLVIAAVAATMAVPAFAADINPGRQMQADLLGLNASEFTTSELGQIASEKNTQRQAIRANFIAQEKAAGIVNAVASDDDVAYFGLHTSGRGHDN
ncbi:hypothetical protein [Paracoccus shanxieyensis]|uniref:Uncharacterized protein n=1 Tax=Paracoccus shanxieyensis TaxID=2675752 RepID=A0A6L6IZH3_9RHOB|nr:hypothetical protein [Paracoccus shanxieyensis]MTH65663.1 hypothetical protein [Paracoccus shanxieyensis]MTH88762.1 hypothetical protein [Paracoccus shanxieyensis]